MASAGLWVAGARPRTFPAAISPVLVGTGAADLAGGADVVKAALALVVALALQVGVNYANDYSDGVRGTDAVRVGPLRLVGSGSATPAAVRAAAFGAFGVAAVGGLVLAATTSWWLLAVGALCIAAAWLYTGGSRPYGYRALGEVAVFVFFGLVAVLGSTYVQLHALTWVSLAGAIAIGCLACALLAANNLRDIPSDTIAGKRTLAVVIGDRRARLLYAALMLVPFALAAGIAITTPWALLAFGAVPLGVPAIRRTVGGAAGGALIPVLQATGVTELAYAVLLTIGLVLG